MESKNVYPKRYMTIKELVPFGFTVYELNKYVQIHGFPAYKPPGKTSTWKIDTSKLDSWLMRRFGTWMKENFGLL